MHRAMGDTSNCQQDHVALLARHGIIQNKPENVAPSLGSTLVSTNQKTLVHSF